MLWCVDFRTYGGGVVCAICDGVLYFRIVVICFIRIGAGIVIVKGLEKGVKSFGLVMLIC